MQAIHEQTTREALLDLLLTNEEELLDDVEFKGSVPCSDQETVELKILRGLTKTNRTTTAPDFTRAHLNLSRGLLGRMPWETALECRGSQESRLTFKDSLLRAQRWSSAIRRETIAEAKLSWPFQTLSLSMSHGIIECFGLEGTFTGHLIRLLRALSNLTWNVSRDGASTTSLGNLFQCLTTLIVKNFFLKSSLNLPFLSLKPLLLVLSQQALLKLLEGFYKVSRQPSLLQAEQPQLSQPVLVGEVLQPSDHFCGPPLDPLQQLHVLLVLRAPELDAVLQLWSHQSRPRIPLAFWAASTHCRLTSSFSSISTPKSFSTGLLSITSSPSLIETEETDAGPLLQLVQVPLDDIPSFWRVSCTTQLGVICKLAERALHLSVNAIDENIGQHRSQHGPLRDNTPIDCYPLRVTIQPIPYPLNSPPIKSISLQFRGKDVVGDRVKGLTGVQIDDIRSSSLVH
ncbi:hypothetical protein QYF61_009858 [Mycteria americana]|uniref:Uncharacterized protein n=1 Tax=Mycteria americana TaxID=33587 RepID=A0AAN7N567_MYCAM|nr:hypothetical protein QYF61_009858 [Mycteria americana]